MPNVPLHPMIVHFPIVFSILLPLAALAAFWAMRTKLLRPAVAWAVPAALSLALAGSAYAAIQTGEAEEDRVERVVPESVLHEHEEAAERFLAVAAIVAIIALAGLARGTVGSAARVVATVGSLVIVFTGFQVGKAGGELVYEHNAGAAYGQNVAGERAAVAEDGDSR